MKNFIDIIVNYYILFIVIFILLFSIVFLFLLNIEKRFDVAVKRLNESGKKYDIDDRAYLVIVFGIPTFLFFLMAGMTIFLLYPYFYSFPKTSISKAMLWTNYTKNIRLKKGIAPEFLKKIDTSLKFEELKKNIYAVAIDELIEQSSLNEYQKKNFKSELEDENINYDDIKTLLKWLERKNKDMKLEKILNTN